MTAMSDRRRTEFARHLHAEAAALLQRMTPSMKGGVVFKLRNLPDGQGTVMEYEVRAPGVRECVRVTVESVASLTGEAPDGSGSGV